MKKPWPVTIIEDRYGGTYSGAKWLAFNKYPEEVGSSEAMGDDCSCAEFFADTDWLIGKGDTPQSAYEDLFAKWR